MRRPESLPQERPELPVVERPRDTPAKDFAYQYIKRLIVDLVLPPGDLITEMDIAKVTGLSRTPVREAFLRLDAEKLIQLLPRRGALVTQITARQIRELHRTRLALELYAVQELCTRRIEVAEELRPIVERQEKLTAEDAGYPEIIACDREFHTTLVTAVGNTVLTEVYSSMGDRQQRTGIAAFLVQPDRPQRAVENHRQIIEALEEFDLASTQDLLRDHLDHHTEELERYLP
ncbi:GntR family transcriptional regulator [Sciscionella sediminilitoris]|uniref:GntR family transcriptional regulator n=1 Tax=Sciscionella sediminilitoris TaxID=1445613 RepID=UPI0004DFC2B7|nr:GntR family transcriptional regulator [Sciscionella sp. SE31]